MTTTVRGVRGAITCASNDADAILSATGELLQALIEANRIQSQDVGCAWFTVTHDLDAAFPARAARDLGWTMVPLMCTQEIPVLGSLPLCVRVMLLWNTDVSQDEVVHLYLRGAKVLRPDIALRGGCQ